MRKEQVKPVLRSLVERVASLDVAELPLVEFLIDYRKLHEFRRHVQLGRILVRIGRLQAGDPQE